MTERINGKEVVGQITVKPEPDTEYLAKILKCSCPSKALEVHPLSKELALFRGLTPNQAVELLKQQGWVFSLKYADQRSE